MSLNIEEYGSLLKMLSKSKLASVLIVGFLLHYSREDESKLTEIIATIPPLDQDLVFDVLSIYPWTDFGWGCLPISRSQHLTTDLSRRELTDIENCPFQEDRPHVERIRRLLRPF
jgi:hypothetical protein